MKWLVCCRGSFKVSYVVRAGHFYSVMAAAAVSFANARAEACTCGVSGPVGVWPRDGATGTAVDTPFVVRGHQLGQLAPKLVAKDGTEVKLQESRRLVPPGTFECLKYSYAFFTAPTDLAQNTRYSFTADFDDVGNGELTEAPRSERTVSFVTGADRRDSSMPEVRLSLYGAALGPRSVHQGLRAAALLDVYVETEAIEPLLVVAHGKQGAFVHYLDPISTDRPFRIGFGPIECAELTVVDVSGTTVADRVLCEPSKCTEVTSIAESPCGGESFAELDWSAWQNMPEGCDGEVSLQTGGEVAGATNGPAVDMPSDLEVPASAGGCGFSAQSSTGCAFGVACLLAALARARTSRRAPRPVFPRAPDSLRTDDTP